MDSANRRGVILLVVMVVLALFTLLGLTLVLVTAQGRLSALASARANPQYTREGAAMDEAFNQVVRGTRDPDSPLQAHSLLEDIYGFPQLFGRITAIAPMGPGTATVPQVSGQLLTTTIIATAGYNLAPTSGAYVGQVITMLDGPAQGHSARVVGYAYNANSGQGFLQLSALDGLMPNGVTANNLGDQFVINGRPFSGTGFGFNWYGFTAGGTPLYSYATPPTTPPSNTQLLNATDPTVGVPYALLPNHANFTPNFGINYYDPAGPAPSLLQNARLAGSANEPYDAVDFQNMLLSLRYYDATLNKVVTVSPSLHRPELLAYFAYWATTNTLPGISLSGANLMFRSKVILRPEPGYQQFQDLNGNTVFDYREPFIDMNGDGLWESGELFVDLNYDSTYTAGDIDFTGKPFNPITGPYCYNGTTNLWATDNTLPIGANWDVDNDSDGTPDSIWVDLGMPVQKAPDGTQFKYLAAILLEELDGKINLNAHGTTTQLDVNRYTIAPFAPPIAGPYVGTTGSFYANGYAPIGQGYGTPEINPAYFLQFLSNGTNVVSLTGLTYFSYLMQGSAGLDPSGKYPVYYDGKYGESGRLVGATYSYPGVYIPSSTTTLANPLTAPYLLYGGPRPGWSRWFDLALSAKYGYSYVDDAFALTRFSDVRPMLLQPSAQWGSNQMPWSLSPPPNPYYDWSSGGLAVMASPYTGPGYFFDFVNTSLYPNAGTAPPGATLHVPTAYGTPHDLPGRGVVAVDLRGQPYYGGTTAFPWMGYTSDPALTGALMAIQGENDAVDSPYELDLSKNAQRDGRNTGDNYSGNGIGFATIDAPYTATELSAILRSHDSDAAGLRTRLDTFGVLASLTHPLSSDIARLAVTTESWDLPVPGVLPTPLQVADIMTFNNQFGAVGATMPLNGLSVADLARARIFAENLGNSNFTGPPSAADLALFGNPAVGVWSLLSPDLVMGLRLDVNRLLGNGQDDNGNGVVDEPAEALLGEAMLFPANLQSSTGQGQGVWAYLDQNNDGLYAVSGLVDPSTGLPLPPDLTPGGPADTRARQLLAKHLYVLMMLMIDDRFVTASAYQAPTTSPMFPWNTIPSGSKEAAAYLVAQWAINAVDFRDRDSIMTPFEFDLHPFVDDDGDATNGTWDVDDIVGTRGAPVGDDNDPFGVAIGKPPVRGLVWGCERPSVLITETLAFHDRGTDDTSAAQPLANSNKDTVVNQGDPMQDQDYDQVRRPRGSVAVELFNTTSPSDAPARDLQYDPALPNQPWVTSNITGQGINLLQVATGPATGVNPTKSPVWRLAIVFSPLGYDSYTGLAPATVLPLDPRAPVIPDSANAMPPLGSPTIPSTNAGPNYIYRVAYFAPYQAAFQDPMTSGAAPYINGVPGAQSFFGDPTVVGGFLMLPPNQYAIVGSAATSTTGMDVAYLGNNNSVGGAFNQNTLEFVYGGGGSNLAYMANVSSGVPVMNPPYDGTQGIKAMIGVPIQTNWLDGSSYYIPHGAVTPARTLRFSISEPPTGYPVLTSTAGPITADDSFFYTTPGSPVAGLPFPQHPWDSGQYASATPAIGPVNPYVAPSAATASGNTNDSSMTSGYTLIYLQRLANPLAVWDPYANPYITVDRMPLDLAAYNGEYSGTGGSTTTSEPKGASTVAGYGYTSTTPGTIAALESRRRGNNGTGAPELGAPNIWKPVSWPAPALTADGSSYAAPLTTASFGYLNYQAYEYGPYWNLLSVPPPPTGTGVPAVQYYGDPAIGPFPWLPWNDRPYVSQYELMLVPVSSPSSLLSDFGMIGQTMFADGEYFPGPTAAAGQLPIAAFRHLLNFEDSQNPTTSISHLYRIFEYIHVPSRFTGTQTMLTPGLFSGLNAGPAALPQPHFFHPPFNWLPRYREPGRVNLNTILPIQDPVSKLFYPLAFEGLMDNYPGYLTLWNQMLGSRQGFGAGTAAPVPNPLLAYSLGAVHGMYPTYYANPFRPDSEAAFTPPLYTVAGGVPTSMTHKWGSYTPAYMGLGAPVPPVAPAPGTPSSDETINATMLRMTGANANPTMITPPPSYGLFDDTAFDPNNTTASYVYPTSLTPYRDAGRNPYFQYQAYQRLGNLVTNRSNVYAIWITLGKFEVQPVAVSNANPDGYQIIGEMGDGSGDHQRQRAFYIFDRSIPVGFVRGQNLNVENAVLLEQQLD